MVGLRECSRVLDRVPEGLRQRSEADASRHSLAGLLVEYAAGDEDTLDQFDVNAERLKRAPGNQQKGPPGVRSIFPQSETWRRALLPDSRVRATGRSNATPCQPSTTAGPDAPSPSRKRPSVSDHREPARPAIIAALRANTDDTWVPSCSRSVLAAHQPSSAEQSYPHGSLIHTPYSPTESAVVTRSVNDFRSV